MKRNLIKPVVPLLFTLAIFSGCGRAQFSQQPVEGTPTPASSSTPSASPTPTIVPQARVADPRLDDAALYDSLASDLGALSGSARQARVDAFWTALDDGGGAPARANGRVIFTLRDGNDGWYVAGSFNAWNALATPMTRIAGTDTLVADVAVNPGDRISYKFVNNGYWAADPDEPWVEFDGVATGTIGNFNSLTFPGTGAAFGRSALYRFSAHATALANDRDVFVQVPAAYFPARAALPLLVMHDGNESICRGLFDSLLDDARDAGNLPTILIAYVALHDQAERMDEYTFGTTGARGLDYESFVADELVPDVEARFVTPKTAASRGIIGASLGGLISYRIGFDRGDVFSRVGGQSSSFFWNSNQMINDVSSAGGHGGRWYLDAGSDADNGDVAVLMKNALDAKGYDEHYVRDMAASHDWFYWGERLPGAVAWMFAN